MEVVEAARLCYKKGWRDKNLVTIVAIIGAETGYDPNFNDGDRFGLFGLHPHENNWKRLLDPEYSALVARERYEKRFFALWVSYATGKYYNFVESAVKGVSELYLEFFKDELHG
jgi:hypothetical protein